MRLGKGARLGPYEILGPLGAGGMAEVYRAHDERLERHVALKLLPRETADDPSARARLLREARAAAVLNHPHVVTIFEVGEEAGEAFIAMELVAGRPLSEAIPAGGLPADAVLRYGCEIAEALAHAHERGIVHRDVKTSNVILASDGRAKVMDFGLAKHVPAQHLTRETLAQTSLTGANTIVGTPEALAPEVLHGEAANERSDLWALGVVLYEMACGEPPFRGQTLFETSDAILNREPRPLSARVPPGLQAVIARCLEKEPGRRFQRASEVRAALEALRSDTNVTARRRPVGPRRLRWALAAVLVIALLAAGTWLSGLLNRATPDPRTVLILPLEVLGQARGAEYVGQTFAHALAVKLAQASDLKILPIPEAMRETGSNRAIQSARRLGAGRVLTGKLVREGAELEAQVQLLDVSENRIVWGSTGSTGRTDVTGLAGELASAAAKELGVSLGKSYDFPLYLSGSPDFVSSPEAIRTLEAWHHNRVGDAIEASRRLVEVFPAELGAHALRGYVAYQMGGPSRADSVATRTSLVTAITAMERLDPGNPYGDRYRAYLARSRGRQDEARRLAARVLSRSDVTPAFRAWVLREVAIGEASQFLEPSEPSLPAAMAGPELPPSIAEELRESIRLDPANPWAYAYLSEVLRAASRSGEALEYAQRAQALEPSMSYPASNTALVLASMGRWEESLPLFAEACSLSVHDETKSWSLALYAIALRVTGREAEAGREALKAEALRLDRSGAYHLARYWALVGNRARALRFLKRSVALGYADGRIRHEAEFAPLRSNPEFRALVATVEQHARSS